jgi:hypothetical protein
MMRRGVGRVGRPGLVGTAARTAVIAGTATAVSGKVAAAGQQKAAAQQAAAQQAAAQQAAVQEAAAPPAAPAAPAAAPGLSDDVVAQLTKLAELRDAGILTDEEFSAKKAQLLGL